MPLKALLALLILAAAAALALLLSPDARTLPGILLTAAETQPATAVLYFAIGSITAVLLALPSTPVMILAGYLFGVPAGMALSVACYMIGAALAFKLARGLLHERVQHVFEGSERFPAFDRAVARNGFMAVLLSRLAYVVPYNLLNYACGLTSLSLRDFVLGSLIGIMPEAFVSVVIGATTTDIVTELTEGSGRLDPRALATIAALVLLTAAALLLFRRYWRALLKAAGRRAAN